MSVYRTVAGLGEAEIVEKKSRFIAHVSPAEDETGASRFIAGVKKKQYDARHNIFAYSIGLSDEISKASDDGEPSGTAGIPVLDILRREKIRNCVIVVTRYFGGTLLGTGGLVRAYSLAAKMGLEAAGVIEKVQCVSYVLTINYHTYGKIQYELEKNGFKTQNASFAENVSFEIIAVSEREEELLKRINEICAGRQNLKKLGTDYYDLNTVST